MRQLLFLLVLTAAPAVVDGQSRDTALLRGELAIGLLEFEWSPRAPLALTVGAASPRFPAGLIPPGARILGGTPSNLLMQLDVVPDSASAAVERHLISQGLRAPNQQRQEPAGFISTSDRRPIGGQFCRDSSTFFVRTRPSASGTSSMVQVRYNPPYRGSPCSVQEFIARGGQDDSHAIVVPLLVAPPGSNSRGGGLSSGSSGDEATSTASTELETTLGAAAVIDHYGAQLAAKGWVLSAPLANQDAGLLVARTRDAQGRNLVGVLTDVRGNGRIHVLSFYVLARTER